MWLACSLYFVTADKSSKTLFSTPVWCTLVMAISWPWGPEDCLLMDTFWCCCVPERGCEHINAVADTCLTCSKLEKKEKKKRSLWLSNETKDRYSASWAHLMRARKVALMHWCNSLGLIKLNRPPTGVLSAYNYELDISHPVCLFQGPDITH